MAADDERQDKPKKRAPSMPDVHGAQTVVRSQESDIQALIEAARRGDARPVTSPPPAMSGEEVPTRPRGAALPTPAIPFPAVPLEAFRGSSPPTPPSGQTPAPPTAAAASAVVPPEPPPAPAAPISDHDVAAKSPTAGPVMAETPPPPDVAARDALLSPGAAPHATPQARESDVDPPPAQTMSYVLLIILAVAVAFAVLVTLLGPRFL